MLCFSAASSLILGVDWAFLKDLHSGQVNNSSVENSFHFPNLVSAGHLQPHHNWMPWLCIRVTLDNKSTPRSDQTSQGSIPLVHKLTLGNPFSVLLNWINRLCYSPNSKNPTMAAKGRPREIIFLLVLATARFLWC